MLSGAAMRVEPMGFRTASRRVARSRLRRATRPSERDGMCTSLQRRILPSRGLAATLVVLSMACSGGPKTAAGSGVIAGDVGAACPSPEGLPTDAGRSKGEVPLVHRSSGSACPQQRANANSTPACGVAGVRVCESFDQCAQDSDCTAGLNGRCSEDLGLAVLNCSYDECFADSDCDAGPCVCRPSTSSSAPNLCYTAGNCTIDSDCGSGGWCSPSGGSACDSYALCADAGLPAPGTTSTAPPSVGCWESSDDGGSWTATQCLCGNACGQAAYYCHTACDVCVNDSDCSSGSCEYDVHNGIWDCFDIINPQ